MAEGLKLSEEASRLLRRTIPQTGHLMMPRSFWMKTTPNEDVDVVITFPPGCAESTVLWFKRKIETIPGVILRVKAIVTTAGTKTAPNCFSILLSASYDGYLRGLELMQCPKDLKQDCGGGQKEFVLREASSFKDVEDVDKFISSQERQAVIFHLLNGIRADKEDSVENLRFRDGEAILPRSLSAKVVSQIFPIHDQTALQKLQKSWVQSFVSKQPIGEICDYFGVKIALYFAWLGHYTTALCIPALVGICFWVFFSGREEFLEDIGFVMFAFFNVIWATLYLESWKRHSAELSYRWGTIDQRPELLAEPRPLFKGVERISDITGKPELTYPPWKRYLFRYLVTFPVIFTCLLVVFASVLVILELQQWLDEVIKQKSLPGALSFLPKVLLAVMIPVLDNVYSNIAVWLNDMENYRTEGAYEDQLIMKLILFQFVNSFLSLFYTAFYLKDIEKLKELLATLLITRQVVGNIKESLVPYVKKQLRLAKLSFDVYGALSPTVEKAADPKGGDDLEGHDAVNKTCPVLDAGDDSELRHRTTSNQPSQAGQPSTQDSPKPRNFSQVECESSAPQYDGTFEDYLEMFIQFGYVILFSSAYPLAGFFALLNNIFEIRGDAFKMCHVHQRPFGQRVNSIGSWQTAMEMMGIVGVIVNCALIGQSGQVSRMFPNITGTQTIVLIIVLEHVMILLKVGIAYAIPDIPAWVEKEMAKIEFRRREIEKQASSTTLVGGSSSSSACPSSRAHSQEAVDKGVQTLRTEDSPTNSSRPATGGTNLATPTRSSSRTIFDPPYTSVNPRYGPSSSFYRENGAMVVRTTMEPSAVSSSLSQPANTQSRLAPRKAGSLQGPCNLASYLK